MARTRLAEWLGKLASDDSAQVEVDSYDDYAILLDAVRGIRWPARSAVRGGIPGAHTSRLRGISAEFTEYRPYRQGDDPRRIDWKLFARSNRAYIRLSNDRAILPTMIVIDASASMAFPVATNAKWKLAAQLGVGLGAGELRRIFHLRQFKPNERPSDFAFVHCYGWDNYGWFRGQVDISRPDFYDLSSEERLALFITKTIFSMEDYCLKVNRNKTIIKLPVEKGLQ